MNEVVKYHNDFSTQVKLKNFNSNELDLLMVLCSKLRDKETNEMLFSFEQLKEIVQWNNNNEKLFIDSLVNTNKKLLALDFTLGNEKKIIQFALFTSFETDIEEKILTVSINEKFAYLLNQLNSHFTRFELTDFIGLKSKYTKLMYRILMQFKSTGYLNLSIEEFNDKLDIPSKYRMSEINKKILKPIERELSKVFSEFRIEKIKYKKRVTHIEFYFTPRTPAEQNIKNIQEAEVVKDKKIIKQDIKINAIEQWINSKQGLKYNNIFKEVIKYLKSIKYSDESIINYLDRNYNYVFNLSSYKNKSVDDKNKIFITKIKNREDVIDIEKEKKYLADKKKLDEEYQNLPPLSEELAKHMTTKIHQENILPKVNNVIDKKTEEYDVQYLKASVRKLPIEKKQILINELKTLSQDKGYPEVMINDENMLINLNSEYVKNYLNDLEKEKINKNKKDDEDDIDPIGGLFAGVDNQQGNTTQPKNYKYDMEYIREALYPKSKWSFKAKELIHVTEVYDRVYNKLETELEKNIFSDLRSKNEIDTLLNYFEKYIIDVFNDYFGKGLFNTIKNVKKTEFKVAKQEINYMKNFTFKTIDEAKEYINNNLDKFKNKLLSKNGKELKGGALNSKINKLAEELLATQ